MRALSVPAFTPTSSFTCRETGYRVRRELVESTGMTMAARLLDFDHL